MKEPLRFFAVADCGPMDKRQCFERHSERLLCRRNHSRHGWLFRWRRLRHLRAGGGAAYWETRPRKSLAGGRQYGWCGESHRRELHV